MIFIDQATKSFGSNTVFSDLSLTIEKGKNYLLTGPNGSGKTTFLMLIKGLYSFDKGTCVYQKNTIGHNDISLISKNNKSFFLRLTVKQNLDFFITPA